MRFTALLPDRVSLVNVPTSAHHATSAEIVLTGPGITVSEYIVNIDNVGGGGAITMDVAVSVRNRLEGGFGNSDDPFTDGEKVGLAYSGSDLAITRAGYKTNEGALLSPGTYTFTINGDAYLPPGTTYDAVYADHSSNLLPVVDTSTGVDLARGTGFATQITPGTDVDDVNPNIHHYLTWDHVNTGGIGGTDGDDGAGGDGDGGWYEVRISPKPPTEEVGFDADSLRIRREVSSDSCINLGGGGTPRCAAIIPAHTFEGLESYYVQIVAFDDDDDTNRSTTAKFTFNTTAGNVQNDFNGDGKSDIFLRHTTNGYNMIWLMDGFTISDRQWIDGAPTTWAVQPD